MKKLLLCLGAIVSLCSLQARSYNFKKGKVSAYNTAMAKYDSKGSVFQNLKLKFASLDGQPLINVEVFNHDFENPLREEPVRLVGEFQDRFRTAGTYHPIPVLPRSQTTG